MSPDVPRVVLVDDSADLREVVRFVLERDGVAVLGEAPDGEGALEAVRRCSPDVVVLDAGIPGQDVAMLIACLTAEQPAPRIVVFSGLPAAELEGLGIEVVTKSSDPATLVAAVRREAVMAAGYRERAEQEGSGAPVSRRGDGTA